MWLLLFWWAPAIIFARRGKVHPLALPSLSSLSPANSPTLFTFLPLPFLFCPPLPPLSGPSPFLRGVGSAVSSPSGVRGAATAANPFWLFWSIWTMWNESRGINNLGSFCPNRNVVIETNSLYILQGQVFPASAWGCPWLVYIYIILN